MKELSPYRAAAHVTGSIAQPELAALNDMITCQAAFTGVIDQFKRPLSANQAALSAV